MNLAIEEIREGAKKGDTDNKKMIGCCLLLLCVVISMLYLIFATNTSTIPKVATNPD